MNIDEARELRQELNAIEATMESIIELWESKDFPTLDELKELTKEAANIEATMDAIAEKGDDLLRPDSPTAPAVSGRLSSAEDVMQIVMNTSDPRATAAALKAQMEKVVPGLKEIPA